MMKSLASVSAVYVIGVPLALIVNIVLARWLPVEEFGQYSFAIAAATFLAVPVSGGLPLLLTREVSTSLLAEDTPAFQRVLTTSLAWVGVASLVVILGVLAFGAYVMPGRSALLTMAALMVPALSLMAVGEGVLKGAGRPALAEAIRQLAVPPILIVAALWLLQGAVAEAGIMLRFNLLAYLFVGLAGLWLVIQVSKFPVRPLLPGGAHLQAWGPALLSFALISGMTTLSTQFATLLLGFLGNDEHVAYLRVAERGALLVAFPLMIMNAIIGPRIVEANRAGRPALQALSRQSARLTLALALPVALILISLGKPLIGLTFGDNYVEGGYLPLVFLSVGQLLGVAFGSPALILMMTGHERRGVTAQATGLSIMMVSVTVLAVLFGADGAAVGIAIGLVMTKLLVVLAVRRNLGFLPGVI
ncbi:oligosaccharide flippase family protein [Gimibacter soli]|uniref:Oligosaccharide flippase family protein n=1 Tax=Gimibacter soli TaxID=3024400 RepID=A0AAE9XNG4_9PROT|nr:oligosaccharide flippase family protein [Gimibacter soli]WCL53381.1 oligosaccharide flippase family protein [Gimibacter soli]